MNIYFNNFILWYLTEIPFAINHLRPKGPTSHLCSIPKLPSIPLENHFLKRFPICNGYHRLDLFRISLFDSYMCVSDFISFDISINH